MRLGVLQQKGGCGKSTLAINIATAFALDGARVLFIDGDPQCSALTWAQARQAKPLFPVIGMPKPTIHKDIQALSKDYDITIIDGAPQAKELGRSAILASDFVLMPVQPSPFDVWALDKTVELITEAQVFRPDIRAAFVINRKIANTALGRDVTSAFKAYPFPVAPRAINQRVVFAETIATGSTVVESAPGSLSAHEIHDLVEFILEQTKERKDA